MIRYPALAILAAAFALAIACKGRSKEPDVIVLLTPKEYGMLRMSAMDGFELTDKAGNPVLTLTREKLDTHGKTPAEIYDAAKEITDYMLPK